MLNTSPPRVLLKNITRYFFNRGMFNGQEAFLMMFLPPSSLQNASM